MSRIKVKWIYDSLGGAIGWPVADQWQRAFRNHMQELHHPDDDGTAYTQNPEEDLPGLLPPRKLRELCAGWPVTVLMDPYDFGMVLGYDACHVTLENSL